VASVSRDSRPDPDQLLRQILGEEERRRRGKLRIYFGANAGVGKTYAMLSAAHRDLKAGRNVLVGVVETHGRSETSELLAGLPRLPLRELAYRDRVLREFDLDEALRLQPEVLLVDELAHSNVEGSRHRKRWQDVEELLDAGIDVWSAVNVQHLESLNGTVGAITGVRVHETVPDTVLDGADEIVLVDVTPDELVARLKAGKVYLPQQAERAAQNFFRKGNLIALREIALRRTAEHVEDDVRSWRVEQSGSAADGMPAWNTSGAILACVGPSEGAEQTVRMAARLAGQLNVDWYASYVETSQLKRLDRKARDHILAVLKLAEELGAQTSVLAEPDAPAALVRQAHTLNCAMLVVGRPREASARLLRWFRPTMTRRLARLAPALDIVEVGQANSARKLGGLVRRAASDEADDERSFAAWMGYGVAVASSVAITVAASTLLQVFAQPNIVMLYLLGTVLVALRYGRGPAALAAFLNVAAFDYFFVAPRLSFAVSDVQYLLTFVVMLIVGLITGQLTAGLRFQASIASSRERRAQALFELTRELSGALLSEQVTELGRAAVQRTFGGQAVVLTTDANDQIVMPASPPEGFDASVADWAFRNGQSAGLATATLAAQSWHYMPLAAPMRIRGVLALKPAQPRWLFIPEQVQQLQTLARQIAIALERVHYVDVAQRAVVDMESEQLRNALLAAISHDVRTPLTALLGLAESLQRSQPPLTSVQGETTQAIMQQARELHALVSNLLDMARLQSGTVHLRNEWQSTEEVVGTAIRQAQPALGGAMVQTSIPGDLPLVEFDAALIERVLVNLLENAAKYGRPPIEMSVRAGSADLQVDVRDHGPGLPTAMVGREDQLFDKFTRGDHESSTPGVGLGLAIAKTIVEAHGGSIGASNASDGGAVFTVTLPRRTPPAMPE
jgi:two-component system sensor histidine kinase KdpD